MSFTRKIIDHRGNVSYYNGNNLDREDGPAEITWYGRKTWYKNGIPHREDGPAVEFPDGTLLWIKKGNIHRDDGPAIIRPGEFIEWYIDGIKMSKEEWWNALSEEMKLKVLFTIKSDTE